MAIGNHLYLAVFLALATALTVFIISYAYSRIIEHFPSGGGGYIVATHTIGSEAGVVSGSALLVDYMLTITVSIAACAEALFSFVPPDFQRWRLVFAVFLVLLLILLNLRGVKESVMVLAPIFLLFIATHAILLGYGIFSHTSGFGAVSSGIQVNLSSDLSAIGLIGILAIFFRAYSLGAGTYTGIEAVANGLQIMREPRVQTGKRTMAYMASSLALVAGALFLCYLLWHVIPVPGMTLNAVLAGAVFSGWPLGGLLAFVTILSEGALLMVAAQTGFIDGPRVMANMAIDSWLPRRFASLSERLVMQDGIFLMGTAALVLLVYARGSVAVLVVMYAINVFVTFSLSEFGMSRFFFTRRREDPLWKRHISIHLTGLVLCTTILSITVYEKFTEGGWLTLLITASVIAICFLIKRHYREVTVGIHRARLPPEQRALCGDGEHGSGRPEEDDRCPARHRLQRVRPPYLLHHPQELPEPVRELHLRLGRGRGLRLLQGGRGSEGPRGVGEGRSPRSTWTWPAPWVLRQISGRQPGQMWWRRRYPSASPSQRSTRTRPSIPAR